MPVRGRQIRVYGEVIGVLDGGLRKREVGIKEGYAPQRITLSFYCRFSAVACASSLASHHPVVDAAASTRFAAHDDRFRPIEHRGRKAVFLRGEHGQDHTLDVVDKRRLEVGVEGITRRILAALPPHPDTRQNKHLHEDEAHPERRSYAHRDIRRLLEELPEAVVAPDQPCADWQANHRVHDEQEDAEVDEPFADARLDLVGLMIDARRLSANASEDINVGHGPAAVEQVHVEVVAGVDAVEVDVDSLLVDLERGAGELVVVGQGLRHDDIGLLVDGEAQRRVVEEVRGSNLLGAPVPN